jgi:hypothetical protein
MIVRSPITCQVIELRETLECGAIEKVLRVYGAKYSAHLVSAAPVQRAKLYRIALASVQLLVRLVAAQSRIGFARARR